MIRLLKSFFGPLSPVRLAGNRLRSYASAVKYGFPAKNMKTIAVTGTDGKSTTSLMICHILEAADMPVGMSCSLDYRILGETVPNTTKMTTSSPNALNRLLAQMKKRGVKYLVMETTSHALMQGRLCGIWPDVAVWTNLSREHLDYHGTMENYRNAKGKLFNMLMKGPRKQTHHSKQPCNCGQSTQLSELTLAKTAILNRDDPEYSYFSQFPADIHESYSVTQGTSQVTGGAEATDNISATQAALSSDATLCAENVVSSVDGSTFDLTYKGLRQPVQLLIPGLFNISNALAAAGAALSVGVSLSDVAKGLGRLTLVPGRMQMIDEGQDFSVLIDYAVTPASLTALYETISQTVNGRIIHVFGSCGDRDQGKRPIMGQVVGSRADIAIVTNEDPYSEDPRAIMDAVFAGVVGNPQYGVAEARKNGVPKVDGENAFLIEDRREAIARALKLAQAGDLVVMTGKGSETVMQVGDERLPWSEEDVVREILTDIAR